METKALQKEITVFREELEMALDEIWPPKPEEQENSGASVTSSWAERMEEKRRERKNAVEAITKPSISRQVDAIDLTIFKI